MTISLNGTTGITTPAEVVNGDETVTGNLNVTGNVTVTGLVNANGGGIIKSGTAISTATTSFTGATTGVSTALTASAPVVGTIQIGQVIAGTGIAAGTSIIAQQSGTTGGAGVYTLSQVSSGTVSGTITVVGVDFLNISAATKRVTVMFNGVSTNGTSPLQVQIGGSGGIENTGYSSNAGLITGGYPGAGGVDATATSGFLLEYQAQAAADVLSGHLVLTNLSGNIWVGSGLLGTSASGAGRTIFLYTGTKTTLTTLDRVRITTVLGTPTFDAGSINILYE
jgi:hypothetical protein